MARPEPPAGDRPLTPAERAGLGLLLVAVAGFGGLVLVRSAYQESRKTDLGVYLRAANAVRHGADIYDRDTVDDHGWHYCYPAALAVLLVPLADPMTYEYDPSGWPLRTARRVLPDGSRGPPEQYLRYELSVVLWYVLSAAAVWRAADTFARTALPDAAPGSRRWWYARTVPLYVCAAGVGYTLSRGQVNAVVVWTLAGMFAALARGRSVAGGAWLAGAVTLKVIPALLVLYPMLIGRWRAAIGFVAGLLVLLLVLPAAVWGWEKAVESNRRLVEVVLVPGAVDRGDQTRSRELTDATGTDSQSFLAVVHAWRNPDPATRPPKADGLSRAVHWLVGGAMLAATVWVGLRRSPRTEPDRLILLGVLSVVMLLLTPVSHMHYYLYALPLVAGLWLRGLADNPGAAFADRRTTAVLVGWGLLTGVPLLPGEVGATLRDFGLGAATTVGLWGYGLAALLRR